MKHLKPDRQGMLSYVPESRWKGISTKVLGNDDLRYKFLCRTAKVVWKGLGYTSAKGIVEVPVRMINK